MALDAHCRIRSDVEGGGWSDPFAPRMFDGAVMHLRLKPKRHQFRYRATAVWLDADAPERSESAFFGVDRRAAVSFHRSDHGPRDGGDLRPWVEARLAEIGARPPDRIMILCFPRVLGYVFNPLSVYYCYAGDGTLEALVYEVKNTFGDQHGYAAPVVDGAAGDFRAQAHPKEFFVSPFIDLDKTYHFQAPPPDARLALRIEERDADGAYLIATWNARAQPLTSRSALSLAARRPAAALGITVSIHWQALRLYLKGVPFLGHPGPGRVVVKKSSPLRARVGGYGDRDEGR